MFRRTLTSVVASALPAALMIACGGNSQRAALPPEPTGPNTITEAERRDGWRLLFDGNSTTGWHTYGKQTAEGWGAQDGMLMHTTGGADLVRYRLSSIPAAVRLCWHSNAPVDVIELPSN